MRVLFDQATPVPIRPHLQGHEVKTIAQEGWSTLKNGELLAAAEAAGFDILLTTDKNIRHQQSLSKRKMQLSLSAKQQWPRLRPYVSLVVDAVNSATSGVYVEVAIPAPPPSSKN